MVQFKILTGKMAGSLKVARRFPVRIGRSASADLPLDENGVWDQHLRVEFKPRQGFVAIPEENALFHVNGESAGEVLLRNGDVLELGGAKVQFWLAETRQAALAWREWLVWIGVACVCLAQVALVYLMRP
jgi:pSer/pThr/pTyr-binding forkhead associated (FHA) protein